MPMHPATLIRSVSVGEHPHCMFASYSTSYPLCVLRLNIRVSGSGLTPKKLERAIALSQEKYCSVYHSLRKDIEVKVNYEIIESDNSG